IGSGVEMTTGSRVIRTDCAFTCGRARDERAPMARNRTGPWRERRYHRRMDLTYHWRGEFSNAEMNALHAEGFGHPMGQDDWSGQTERHSLGWVCARDGSELVGFVNVPWDGASHAFIVDTLVSLRARRQGAGTRVIASAAGEAP